MKYDERLMRYSCLFTDMVALLQLLLLNDEMIVWNEKAKAAPRNSLAQFSVFVFRIRIPHKKRKDI
ncbi:hypothetical protein GE21DRAFT_1236676 [Neurospora crassa]|nr:hypothetical protein GE21DRAFT_1236676 [Neurospora crassa]